MVVLKEHNEHCREIVDNLREIVNGSKVNDDGDEITLYDYISDCLDIEYRIDSRLCYKSCKLLLAFGGPNIYLDTAEKQVKLLWWNEYGDCYVDSEICDAIDEIVEELYDER